MKENITDATIRFLTEGLHRNNVKPNKKLESKNTNKVSDLVEIGDILNNRLDQKVMNYCTSTVGTKETVIDTLNEEPKILTPELETAIKNIKGNKVVVYFIDMQEQSKLDNADTIVLGLDDENRIVDKKLLTIESSNLNEAKSSEIQFDLKLAKDDLYIVGNAQYNGVDYKIDAKVFLEGSEYGIDNGPISKLSIKDIAKNELIINYDRGWDKKPDEQNEFLYKETIKALTEFRKEHPYEVTESLEENLEDNDDTYVAVVNGTIYWEGSQQEANENDEDIRLTVQGVAQEDGLNVDTDEIDIMKKSDFENNQTLTEAKSVSDFEDDIDLIIALESDDLQISTEDELNRLKAICEKFKNSQGFYGRLLDQLNQIDSSNLPVII